MNSIQIAHRQIGPNFPPLVIAEIGINHGGSLAVAMAMVDAAKRSGAEVIKHQTHIVGDEMSQKAKQVIPGNANISIYEIMEKCSLNEEDETLLKQYVEQQGMIFLSTPFSRAAAERLETMEVLAYKIGSGECNNYPLIEHIAKFGKPMIISTGMNTLDSIHKTVEIVEKHGCSYALMHTTNLYPTPPSLVRLGAMQALQKEFSNIPIGLSDHTTSNLACFAATALGASILERHFTDSMDRIGPDIINSMDPGALQELITGSKEIWEMRGGEKKPAAEEQVTIDFAFATVVTIKPIQAGETFTKDNIWVKRPGVGGILAEHYPKIIGRKANRTLEIDVHVQWSDIE